MRQIQKSLVYLPDLKTGQMTAGLQQSDLVIIAGRPSMGKTALAMSLLRHVSLNLTNQH